jgi:hypothetical protein
VISAVDSEQVVSRATAQRVVALIVDLTDA